MPSARRWCTRTSRSFLRHAGDNRLPDHEHVGMPVSEAVVGRPIVRPLDAILGVPLGVALVCATAVLGYASSNSKNLVDGVPVPLVAAAMALAALCAWVVVAARPDLQTWIGYASFHLLSWILASVLIVGGVIARMRLG